MINYEETRINKLKNYLVEAVDSIQKNRGFNVNALPKEVGTYSLDKLPTETITEKWIIGTVKKKDEYTFKSRRNYSYNQIENMQNIGFFEKFEKLIYENNKNGILPLIDNIESIECLNCGTLTQAETNTAEFTIQIQITYRED